MWPIRICKLHQSSQKYLNTFWFPFLWTCQNSWMTPEAPAPPDQEEHSKPSHHSCDVWAIPSTNLGWSASQPSARSFRTCFTYWRIQLKHKSWEPSSLSVPKNMKVLPSLWCWDNKNVVNEGIKSDTICALRQQGHLGLSPKATTQAPHGQNPFLMQERVVSYWGGLLKTATLVPPSCVKASLQCDFVALTIRDGVYLSILWV